jgi:signal transduction histidine kinase
LQQGYARVCGVVEMQSIQALVEDALRMQADGLAQRQVRVVRQFEDVPKIPLDKHKVLQILINLITNAKHAVTASAGPEKVVTVSVGFAGQERVRISVADNGVGIAEENLTRIFAHGFTTKKDGHGFGLHSGAIAAREMGGSLVAHSDGLGQGATFTLEFPIQPKEATT